MDLHQGKIDIVWTPKDLWNAIYSILLEKLELQSS